MKTIQLLQACPSVLALYQDRFRYVMMDECQDSSWSNMKLVALLAGGHHNLMLIGDQSQSIYSWRGADVRLMTAFSRRDGVVTLALNNNYRSRPHIVRAANHLIRHNSERLEHDCQATREPSEGRINYYQALSPVEEADFVQGLIRNLMRRLGYRYRDFAILYRTNSQSRLFEEALSHNAIPFRVSGGQGFYSRKEIRDAIAYLRLLLNPRDLLAFQRIANTPNRKLGEASVTKIVQLAFAENAGLDQLPELSERVPRLQKAARTALVRLVSVISHYRSYLAIPTSMVIKDYLHDLGYLPSLDHDQLLLVGDLLSSITAWIMENPGLSLADCIRQLATLSEEPDESTDNCVQLMSIHAAKGKEFAVVFVAGVEESLLPHAASTSARAVEEERRLFYVAITRAKDILVLTAARERGGFGRTHPVTQSRFIGELPGNNLKRI